MCNLVKELVTMPYISIVQSEMVVNDRYGIPTHANACINLTPGLSEIQWPEVLLERNPANNNVAVNLQQVYELNHLQCKL